MPPDDRYPAPNVFLRTALSVPSATAVLNAARRGSGRVDVGELTAGDLQLLRGPSRAAGGAGSPEASGGRAACCWACAAAIPRQWPILGDRRKQSSLSIGALADRDLLAIEIEHEEANGRREISVVPLRSRLRR
jgi:hypothetical protein